MFSRTLLCSVLQSGASRRAGRLKNGRLAQPPRYLVQPEALRAADGLALITVVGRAEEEQLAAGTGIKTLARGLCQRRKAVVLENDLREAVLKGCPHDGFLARRDRGRDKDSPLTAECQGFFLLGFYLLGGEAAWALYLHMKRLTKEEAVADSRERHASPCQRTLDTKELGVITLDKKPARVVSKVAYPVIELTSTEEHLVVVFEGKEDTMLAILTIGVGVLTLHSRVVQIRMDGMKSMAATCFKAVEDVTDMARDVVSDKEDGVEVVGHELEGNTPQVGEASEHALPVGEDSLTKGGRHGVGSVGIAIGLMHVAHNVAEERQATFRDHGYQVDAASAVIVTFQSARHRFLLLSSEKFLSSSCLFIHSF